jgi:beta-alanine degradation protein BauB
MNRKERIAAMACVMTLVSCLAIVATHAASALPDPLAAGWSGAKVCEQLHQDNEQRVLRCTFPPGVGHERHYHDRNFGYVIAGGRMRILDANGTREVELSAGSSFASDGLDWHEVMNVGDTTVVYLVIEPQNTNDLVAFATRYADAWSGQDPGAFSRFYAEDGTFRINDGEPSIGREAIAATARSFMANFPDMVVSLVDVHREGDYVHFHWRWTGTNTGPGGTGNSVDLTGFEQWLLDDQGLILESRGHMDDAEYQRQLNAGGETSKTR